MTIRVVDIETTGQEPPAEVIELGCVDLEEASGQLLNGRSNFVYTELIIPPDARGVHHISNEDLKGARSLSVVEQDLLGAYPAPLAFAAHNAEFEMKWLGHWAMPWVCTFKSALRIWPSAPDHKNQTLRYYLNVSVPVAFQDQPIHRALPDAVVTALILREALKYASLETMIKWSAEPAYLRGTPIKFGKHKGMAWADLPVDYVEWLATKHEGADVNWNAQKELIERKNPQPKKTVTIATPNGAIVELPIGEETEDIAYVRLVSEITKLMVDQGKLETVADLNKWLQSKSSEAERAKYGIEKGTKAYDLMTSEYLKHKASIKANATA